MDEATAYRLRKSVESIVTSSNFSSKHTKLKTIEEICNVSSENEKRLYEYIQKWLKKNHAEIRLGALKLLVERFRRSHIFRQIISEDVNFLLQQTIFGDEKHPLPKPKTAALEMTSLCIKSIDSWSTQYGFEYPGIKFSRIFLQLNLDVDFSTGCIAPPHSSSLSPSEITKERERRVKAHRKVSDELEEWQDQIESAITEFNNAFSLLIPTIDDFLPSSFESKEERKAEKCENGTQEKITINLNSIRTIQETSDNEYLIKSLRDLIKSMKRQYLPKVRAWEKRLLKYSSFYQDLILNIVLMKKQMKTAVAKFSSLTIFSNADQGEDTDEESEGELIDVPVPEEESEISLLGLDTSKFNIIEKDLTEAGPSGIHKATRSSRACIKKSIEDFYDDEWTEPSRTFNSALGDNPVWASNDAIHDKEMSSKPLGISTKIVDVEQPFMPVNHVCGAPLPSGRLCPRKDRIICPLHGKVIARNELGEPIDPVESKIERERAEARERECPSWQDPKLLADIKRETGVDLSMKKAKKRKRKYEELTDISKTTARERLSKKIFSKRNRCRRL